MRYYLTTLVGSRLQDQGLVKAKDKKAAEGRFRTSMKRHGSYFGELDTELISLENALSLTLSESSNQLVTIEKLVSGSEPVWEHKGWV